MLNSHVAMWHGMAWAIVIERINNKEGARSAKRVERLQD